MCSPKIWTHAVKSLSVFLTTDRLWINLTAANHVAGALGERCVWQWGPADRQQMMLRIIRLRCKDSAVVNKKQTATCKTFCIFFYYTHCLKSWSGIQFDGGFITCLELETQSLELELELELAGLDLGRLCDLQKQWLFPTCAFNPLTPFSSYDWNIFHGLNQQKDYVFHLDLPACFLIHRKDT